MCDTNQKKYYKLSDGKNKLAEAMKGPQELLANFRKRWYNSGGVGLCLIPSSKNRGKMNKTVSTSYAVFRPMSLFGLVELTSLPGLLRASPLS